MGIGGFLSDIGNGVKHGLDKTVEGLNVVDRYINPFHQEQTITPGGEEAKKQAELAGTKQAAGFLNSTLEDTMSGMRWLYSNGISQPIATAAMVGKVSRSSNGDALGFGPEYFKSSTWSKAWKAANHVSWGQAFLMNKEEAEHAIDSPLLYYKPPEAYLPPGFTQLPEAQQQQILRDAGMPAIGNAYVEKMRGHSAWFKYGSGSLDFAGVLFLDPTTHGIQAATGIARAGSVIKAPKGGFTQESIDSILAQSNVKKLMDGIWAHKDNPQLLNNTPLAQHSGMGPRFGAVVSTLNDPEELELFVRTGMGDMRAMNELSVRNAAAGARLQSSMTRLAALDLMRSRYAAFPNMQALVDQQMQRVAASKNADAAMINRYDEILRQADTLDKLHVQRWSLPAAEARTAAQNQYLAGPARGGARGVSIQPSTPPLTFTRHAGARAPIDTGIVHTRLWGAADYFSAPVTMIRSVKNAHPNGYMRLDTLDKDSLNELRGHLARIPGIKQSTRGAILNDYMKATTEADRLHILQDVVGPLGAAKVAERYGLRPEIGEEIYKRHQLLQQGERDNMKRYTAGVDPERLNAAGQPLHLDELPTTGGGITLTPFTASRLVNGHTFQDLDELSKVLRRHGSKLETLRVAAGGTRDWVESAADYLSYMWKFSTLFRLGYVPRVLSDDLAGQWASLGAVAMSQRVARGAKNAFHNVALWQTRPALQAREANARAGAEYAADEMKLLQPQMRQLNAHIQGLEATLDADVRHAFRRHQAAQAKAAQLDPADLSPKAHAVRTFARQREQQLRQAEMRLAAGASPGKKAALKSMEDRHDFLGRFHGLQSRAADDYLAQQQKVIQGNQPITIDGKTFPAAFGGKEGEYAYKLVSADESVGNIFNTNKQIVQGNLERSFNHGGQAISAMQDAELHLRSWTHAINNQIMQDPLSRMAVEGRSIEDMTKWLTTDARGMAYRARLPKMVAPEEFARSAKYEVDQYLHTPEIRMKALEPEGVSPSFLDKAVPEIADRPDVHTGRVAQSQLAHANALDRVIQKFYKYAATIPANRMSRHPLYNQLYEGHLKRIITSRKAQGLSVNHMTAGEVEQAVTSARNLALRDTRDLVFDIAHRSDAASALRFVSPFFSATAESFQRWGRIIADKPHIVGYAANWYNAPAYTGHMQDLDGNHIDGEGNVYIPQYPLKPDGTVDYSAKPKIIKRKIPKSQRYIVTRVPKWVADSPLGKAMNITEAGGTLKLSQNSIDLITQGDPWFNPGVGPIVTIPVNEIVKDKPRAAEVARQLGVLPYGPATGNAFQRASDLAAPSAIRNFLTAFDTSDARYQQVKLQIMQREIFEFQEKYDRKPTPIELAKLKERVASKTKDYWLFSASSAFLQPFATLRADPYQFYRDQYNALRNQNPLTADDEFLKRYAESYFIFAQETSKSVGVQPTMNAVDLYKKYARQIAANPELAALVIGPEGNGPFSPEAYAYELNHPVTPGGSEMLRTKMSADQAIEENNRRLGWAKYTSRMNQLNAQLRSAGFASFEDEGAEDFKAQKKAYTALYAEPLFPDGTANPYYNAAWSKDFYTLDARKYERLIPALTSIATSPLADDPRRTDLKTLQQYLGARQIVQQQLTQLQADGLPHTLGAEANSDLRTQWIRFVDSLVESDTRFGDLYHRYLARDLGVDAEEEEQ